MEAFIQYKNTDICLDFHCSCGEHNHYDGYFAYEIACGECGKKFKLSDKIQVTELSPEESKGLGALEPIKFNENREVIEEVEDFSNVKTYPNYKTNVVLLDHDDIDKPVYIAGEGKPEILEPKPGKTGDWEILKHEFKNILSESRGSMTDLEKFLELYRSLGIEPSIETYDSGTSIRLAPDDNLIEGYNFFYTSINFDKNGKFEGQVIAE